MGRNGQREGRREEQRWHTPPDPSRSPQDSKDVVAAIRDAVNVLYVILKRLEGISNQLARIGEHADTSRTNGPPTA